MTEIYIHRATDEAIERVAKAARSQIEHLEREAKKPEYQVPEIAAALETAMAAMRNDCAVAEEFVRHTRMARGNGR